MRWNNAIGYVEYTKSLEMLKFLLGIYAVDIYDMRKELYPYNTAILEYLTNELVYLGETSEMKERVEKILDLFEEGAQLIINDRAKELAELIGIDTSEITPEPEPQPEEPEPEEEDGGDEENNNESSEEESDNNSSTSSESGSSLSGGGIMVPPVIDGENDEFLAPLGTVLLSDDVVDLGSSTDDDTESTENEDSDSEDDEEEEDTGKIGWKDVPGWYEIEYDQDRFIFCWTNVMTGLCVRLKFQYAHLFSDIYDGECCKCGAKGQTESDYEAWTSGVYPEDEMYDRMLYYRNHTAWGTTKVSDVDCTCHRKKDTDTGAD